MKKNILILLICLSLSVLATYLSSLLKEDEIIILDYQNGSFINQKILAYGNEKNTYNKLYNNGQLIAVINNMDFINEGIENEYKNYEDKFPNTSLGLSDDLYIVKEDTYNVYEDVDNKIINYLIENDLLGIKAKTIEFSTSAGVYDIIYVNNLDDFYEARDQFLLNFISKETLESLRNNEKIAEPSDFGTTEMNLRIEETMNFSEDFVSPNKIFSNVNEIYNYFCYGRSEERQYYETVEGDTLSGVGYRFLNMSPRQLMTLNPDIIFSEDQIITPGMVLNVTYFSSPITVVVTKDRLAQETINPDNPIYETDASLPSGSRVVENEEVKGLKNVLYEETWINGVLQTGKEKSSVVIREPITALIRVGTKRMPSVGSGNYIWPVDNPAITCNWGCYAGHTGTDIVNLYEKYGPIYAIDTGVVDIASFHYINGNYVVIDHGNGIKTYYGHMTQFYVEPGQVVQRGDVIGQIGYTGVASGPHVHLHFIVDGTITNACNYLDCGSLPGG